MAVVELRLLYTLRMCTLPSWSPQVFWVYPKENTMFDI